MTRLLHPFSVRYALALWIATILALFVVFVVQLEPAQWTAITVWIIFMQSPRLNYSKIIWWIFGTVCGALMAVVLISLFNQAADLFLVALASWLAVCAAAAALVRQYKAYGFVLAGYTCAIVSMSAADNPNEVFHLAIIRVSCIFIGMASAIVVMSVMLPVHQHWDETIHHLEEFLKSTVTQVSRAVSPTAEPPHFRWRHLVDRLSTLEHTLDVTTAESPESRLHATQTRSLVATLFCVLARSQSIEIHLRRAGFPPLTPAVRNFLSRIETILETLSLRIGSEIVTQQVQVISAELEELRGQAAVLRTSLPTQDIDHISHAFTFDRLDEILCDLPDAIRDWAALFEPGGSQRPSRIAQHLDFHTAFRHALRMLLAMGLVSAIWFVTQWPSGAQLILFTAVVCSLLSLVDHAPEMGWAFLKSAAFCAIMAFIDTFWLLQTAEGFLVLALTLGLFLVPAAYAYRHPRLIGSAVVSMLIFYGLTMPANQMNYDIVAFLNNGLALLCAAACGFFAFHAVPALTSKRRRALLLQSVRNDLTRARIGTGTHPEQRWTSRMFDRLRLLHRFSPLAGDVSTDLTEENELLLGLQIGLRQIRLRQFLQEGGLSHEIRSGIEAVFRHFKEFARNPDAAGCLLRTTCESFDQTLRTDGSEPPGQHLRILAELSEIRLLIQTVDPLYLD